MIDEIFAVLNNKAVPWALSGGILLMGLLLFLRFRALLKPVSEQLQLALAAIKGYRQGTVSIETLSDAIQRLGILENGWRSFKDTLEVRTDELDGKETIYTLHSPSMHMSEARILGAAINLRFYQALPNILVGIGLFFTFIGLVMALYFASKGVAAASVEIAQGALRDLLSAATFKFLTSLAGLFASLIFSWREKVVMHRVTGEIDELHRELESAFQSSSLEKLGVERNSAIRRQEMILGEMLNEARQQTAQLKRFETDFAVSIANALDNKLGPRFMHLAEQLGEAIKQLSVRIGSVNQEALEKMLLDFRNALTQGTGDELKRLASVLEGLAEKLQATGEGLGKGMGEAGVKIADGAGLLESVLVNLKADIVDLGDVVNKATENGKEATTRLFESADQLVRIHSALGETLGEINDAGSSIESVAGTLVESLDDFKTMQENVVSRMDLAFRSASEAHDALKEAGTQIGKVASDLGGAWQSYRDRFEKVDEDLDKTFQSLQEGLENYSANLRTFHSTLDSQFGKAVESLGALVNGLGDQVDELVDAASRRK